MSTEKSGRRVITGALGIAAAAGLVFACQAARPKTTNLATGDAASRVYIAPGQHDEFYSFLSGGFSSQVAVYGIPSGEWMQQLYKDFAPTDIRNGGKIKGFVVEGVVAF